MIVEFLESLIDSFRKLGVGGEQEFRIQAGAFSFMG